MMKKKIIFQIISLSFLVICMVVLSYAWVINGISTNSFIIKTGDVLGDAILYLGEDEDLDGILDTDEDNNVTYNKILNMNATVFSGKILSYKLEVKNYGNSSSTVEVAFSEVTGGILINLFAVENIMYVVSDSETDELVPSGENHFLPSIVDEDGKYASPCFVYDGLNPKQTITIYFQLVCLGFSGVRAYYDQVMEQNLEVDFIEKVNYSIYIENNRIFGIKNLVVNLKSFDTTA